MSGNKGVYLNKKSLALLDKAAAKKNVTKSAFLNDLLGGLEIDNDKVKPIIIKLPVALLTEHKDDLRDWLHMKSDAIINHYYKES